MQIVVLLYFFVAFFLVKQLTIQTGSLIPLESLLKISDLKRYNKHIYLGCKSRASMMCTYLKKINDTEF